MRSSILLLAGAAMLGIAACSKDSSSSTSPGTTTATPTYNLGLDSGIVDSAKATVATAVPIRVKLTKAGAAVSGSSVIWTVTAGHGTLSAATSTTNAAGIATVQLTLGDTAGLNSVTAASQDASVAVRAIGVAGAVASLTKVSADSSAIVTGASVLLTVRTTDKFGNAVSGAGVTWSSSGGALTSATSTSGSSGNAQTVFTPAAKGSYTVTATVAGGASVTFKVTAL